MDTQTTLDTTPIEDKPVEDAVVSISLKTSERQGIYDIFDTEIASHEAIVASYQERIDYNQTQIDSENAIIDAIKNKKALLAK